MMRSIDCLADACTDRMDDDGFWRDPRLWHVRAGDSETVMMETCDLRESSRKYGELLLA